MNRIREICAREVFDSRGNPTVEVEVFGPDDVFGRAAAPSGASTGRHEAIELRDGDPSRFGGKGVLKAVRNVREIIAPALAGMPIDDQPAIDRVLRELDGTSNFSRLGANATLATSLAAAHAAARLRRLPLFRHLWTDDANLPLPMVNMISGGLHAGRQIEFQDFLVLPIGARSVRQALQWVREVHRALGEELARLGLEYVLVGDEGGYGPKLGGNRQALDILSTAISAAGFKPRDEIGIGIDVAATHFYREGSYWLRCNGESATAMSAEAVIELLATWVDEYPIISIEDALAEDDWIGWQKLDQRLGQRVQLVADDLVTTNPQRLARCIADHCANAVLIKPNQIGTLSDALAVLRQAKFAGLGTIVSARSGETEDVTIADLAVATGAGQIKIGSLVRSERLAKYNQLLRIEESIAPAIPFAGPTLFRNLRSPAGT
jgi:enolase